MTKVILVTGCSTGLGIDIAVQAAKAGHRVFATMRNLDKRAALNEAATAAGVALDLLPLDVQSSASVQGAVDEVLARTGRIDVLINNAGAGFVRNIEQASEDEIAWVMDVNFHGVARCTKAVLPHMRAQGAGHVVTISSVGGLVGQPFNEIYCAAKFAVEGFMESLASYVTPAFGIRFSVVEPGGITTAFADNVMRQVACTGGILEDAYKPILMKYIGGSEGRRDTGIYQTGAEVAAVVMGVIEAETPPLRIRTSDWAEAFCALKTDPDPDGLKIGQQVYDQFLAD